MSAVACGGSGATGASTGVSYASVAVSKGHTCALATDGSALCWGVNANGEGGHSGGGAASSPVPVTGGHHFSQVAVGQGHVCGLEAGAALCWGVNTSGELGNGGGPSTFVPTLVSGGLNLASIAAGGFVSCGLTQGGDAYCWGANTLGQLGNGSQSNSAVPVPVGGGRKFLSMAVGGEHVCAITTAHAAYCWGRDDQGQLGGDSASQQCGGIACATLPVAVLGGLSFEQITVGDAHSCGLTTAGSVFCWGQRYLGQLGDGTRSLVDYAPLPVGVASPQSFVSVSAGVSSTCATASGGAAFCWGLSGPWLGDTSTIPSLCHGTSCLPAPGLVEGGNQMRNVVTSGGHSCGLASSGLLYCWGYPVAGELGIGGFVPQAGVSLPTLVLGQASP
jgi:alpha-tubulin suppressor-like RCC1 family protein